MSLTGVTFFLTVLYWGATALYGAAASQVFVQEQFLAPRLSAPLAFFADWHTLIGAGALALWLAARKPWDRQQLTRGNITAVVAWLKAAAVIATLAPLASLQTTTAPLIVVGGAVGALVALSLAEWQPLNDAAVDLDRDRSFADLKACLLAGFGVAFAHSAALLWLEGFSAGVVDDIAVNVRLHGLLAGAAFLGLAAIRAAAAMTRRPVRSEALLTTAALGAALALFLFSVVLHSISIRGVAGAAIAVGVGVAFAFAATARGAHGETSCRDGVAAMLKALSPRITAHWWGFALWLGAIAVIGGLVASASRAADWNFVFLRTGLVLTWLLTFAAALTLSRRFGPGGFATSSAAVAMILASHLALQSSTGHVEAAALHNPSARWLAEVLAPSGVNGASADEIVKLLNARTNLSRDTKVSPVDVSLATLDGPPPAVRPNVFVFVVDSLRRDYLSPYNPAATFTPNIAALASDSLVFRNAFTQYGATGLSVPSIWVGGPILHKQYVTPFAPMNALAKLLEHERYEQWIGMDNIMDVILPASERRRPLDEGVAVKDFRFCATVRDIKSRLAGRRSGSPVFVYSLPQDLHVSAMTREGSRSIDDRQYPGFYEPVASRMRRLDGCLGEFVADLKASGLYDNSVIVFTADHGDSLGEEGRMGHAYSLHPEIVRVPLIMHVPQRLRDMWSWDERGPAYTTDLTPTLYRLLGHEPGMPASFFGEPLALPKGTARRTSRDRMVAASYGAVYGAYLDNGATYYVFDAIAMRELAFSLDDGPTPGAAVPMTADIRERGINVIRQTVTDISTFYRYPASNE